MADDKADDVVVHELRKAFAPLVGRERLEIRALNAADDLQPLGVKVVVKPGQLQARAVDVRRADLARGVVFRRVQDGQPLLGGDLLQRDGIMRCAHRARLLSGEAAGAAAKNFFRTGRSVCSPASHCTQSGGIWQRLLQRAGHFFRPRGGKCAENVKIILQSAGVSAIMRKLFSQTIEKEVLQPMAKCQFCDKGVSFGIKVSHSHRRSNRTWKPNVKRVKAIVDGKPQHVYACTRCLRSGKVTRAV